jgi:hypothetical protein
MGILPPGGLQKILIKQQVMSIGGTADLHQAANRSTAVA